MENHPSLGGGNEEEKQEDSHSSSEPAATPKHPTHWDTSRPTIAPDFLLPRVHGSIHTQGTEEQLSDPWLAAEGLHPGIHKMVVGALFFDLDKSAALTVPRKVIRSSQPLEPPVHYRWSAPKSHANIVAYDPPLGEHARCITAAIRTIEYPMLEKVVLTRVVELEIDPSIDPFLFTSRLIDGLLNRDGFVVDLSPAGPDCEGRLFIGSSPGMLVRRAGDIVEALPLAGSLPRPRNEEVDRATVRRPADPRKNLNEHVFVVDGIVGNLAPLCSLLDVPDSPELMNIAEMQHLATHIRGRLKDPSLSVLGSTLVVYPTPAICGTPTESTFGVIQAVETDRGFYSSAVGRCDESGDGEFVVSIRCAEIDTEGSVARLWAGGGIVSHFNPEEEVTETGAKMGIVPCALGVKGA